MAVKLGAKIVDALLLGPEARRRQLQDFPVLGDVWTKFADNPAIPRDLLIVPRREQRAAAVAEIIQPCGEIRNDSDNSRSVAYLHGLVVASLDLDDLEEVIFPATNWWDQIQDRWSLARLPDTDELRQWIRDALRASLGEKPGEARIDFGKLDRAPEQRACEDSGDIQAARLGLLLGLFQAAAKHKDKKKPAKGAPAFLDTLADAVRMLTPATIVAEGTRAVERVMDRHKALSAEALKQNQTWNGVIFHVTLNRDAETALSASVPAIKADAARSLFTISCAQIAWAILDSGVDHDHLAFRDHEQVRKRVERLWAVAKKTAEEDAAAAGVEPDVPPEPVLDWYPHRIRGTFDFTRIRAILGVQTDAQIDQLTNDFAPDRKIPEADIKKLLEGLRQDKRDREPLDWRKVQPLIELDSGQRAAGKDPLPRPAVPHGTHVAGILAADWREDGERKLTGVCPDILLYDCRVLGSSLGDSEFAVSAALQFIRFFNEQSGHPRVNGVNMSLAIRHNVRNYACGRTPVCLEAEALAANGVVVVAAAGNRGFQQYQLADATTYEGYAASSITDPGNAEGVITVGATHRAWPHTYGVSFFSSRGPTGDGRLKPDLLAPGEKILSCVPGDRQDEMDGTSMAAPHVSGAAALLMGRHEELKGQPQRIKQILCDTATDLKRERSFQGHGMVDVLRAIQSL